MKKKNKKKSSLNDVALQMDQDQAFKFLEDYFPDYSDIHLEALTKVITDYRTKREIETLELIERLIQAAKEIKK